MIIGFLIYIVCGLAAAIYTGKKHLREIIIIVIGWPFVVLAVAIMITSDLMKEKLDIDEK